LVPLCFIKKNGQRRYKYLALGRDRFYFVKHHSDSTKKFSETDIFNMLEFLIDNIFCLVDVFFKRNVKLKDRASFFSFYLRSSCMKSASCE
jgi:hypothetical protein